MKRALVTGVSRGIGRAVAEMLVAEGWYVLGTCRTTPREWQGFFDWIASDVGRVTSTEHLEAFMRETGEPFDALIHCAAVQGTVGPLADSDPTAWLRAIRTNLDGAYIMTRLSMPYLMRSDDGRILLFSGGGAFNARPNYSAYAASKAGVVSLMETLADELRDTNVTVNCVAPGYVPTTMHETPVPDRGEAMAEAVACVRHLLSPQTRGLTGKTISAAWDDWRHITPLTVARVNASTMGTRKREPIAMVGRLANLGERAVV